MTDATIEMAGAGRDASAAAGAATAEGEKARGRAADSGTGRRLFCCSGGAAPGLDIHCGCLLALEEAGILPHAVAGTSAGALIAACIASGYIAEQLREVLVALRDEDVIRYRPLWRFRQRWIGSFLEHAPIRRHLERLLPVGFDGLCMPCTIHCTDDVSGAPVDVTAGGRLREAVLASMAICGFWPPVAIAGQWLSDGGTTGDLPIPADAGAYDEIWLIVANRPLRAFQRDENVLTRLVRNLDVLLDDQVRDTIERARERYGARVRVLWPPVATPHGMLHFEHELIEVCRKWAAIQIEQQRGG